jgi:hypothetical protein
MSTGTEKGLPERGPNRHRASITTAAGFAAERIALADRERERRTSRARSAARQLQQRSTTR